MSIAAAVPDPSPAGGPGPAMPASGAHLARRTMASPLGPLVVVASPAGVRAVLWPGEDGTRIARSLAGGAAALPAADPAPVAGPRAGADPEAPAAGNVAGPLPDARAAAHAERAVLELGEYFDGTRREFDVALDLIGTAFQVRVWQALRTIPYGTTSSYREQARGLGDPAKARAVGAADGRNPVSIIVPCHRVVASSGSLTGFAGGLATKAWLLDHERDVLAAG